jgi:hypothetical protein
MFLKSYGMKLLIPIDGACKVFFKLLWLNSICSATIVAVQPSFLEKLLAV